MTQRDASLQLRISIRTLQRLAQAGHLTVRYQTGKTRPVPVYDDAEIASLKASLVSRPLYRRSHSPAGKKRPFGFRLLPADIATLTEEAARYGMSPGEYARHLVQTGLENALVGKVSSLSAEIAALRQEVAALNRALRDLTNEYTETTEILLEYCGMEPADARHWTNINLRARRNVS